MHLRLNTGPFELPLWYLPFNNAGRYSSVARLFHAPSAPIASQFRSVAVCKGAQTATTLAKVSFQPFGQYNQTAYWLKWLVGRD
jgi:hypothetical protein